MQLGGGATVPPQRVDDLVMLLDAAQQLQTGSLVDVNAPAGKYTFQRFSTWGAPMMSADPCDPELREEVGIENG